MSKVNTFVLIKTSSEDEDIRRLQDVFTRTNVYRIMTIAHTCSSQASMVNLFTYLLTSRQLNNLRVTLRM